MQAIAVLTKNERARHILASDDDGEDFSQVLDQIVPGELLHSPKEEYKIVAC